MDECCRKINAEQKAECWCRPSFAFYALRCRRPALRDRVSGEFALHRSFGITTAQKHQAACGRPDVGRFENAAFSERWCWAWLSKGPSPKPVSGLPEPEEQARRKRHCRHLRLPW